jgi:hypothetical protein
MAFGDPHQRKKKPFNNSIFHNGVMGIRRTRGIETAGRR